MNFQVGDVCVGAEFIDDPEFNGKECVIIAPLHSAFHPYKGIVIDVYECRWSCGETSNVAPRHLRRKPPESDCNQITSWQECLWRPKEMA